MKVILLYMQMNYEKINENIELFNQLDDAYLKERAADLRDICKKIWSKNILGIKIKDLSNLGTKYSGSNL